MSPKHAAWIERYVKAHQYLRGLCGPATKEMVEAFPELKRAAGFADGVEHFWCVAPDGEVVDPTGAQFGVCQIIEYSPFKPGDEVRIGTCMECGSPILAAVDTLDNPNHHKTFCDKDCQTSFTTAVEL